MSFLAKLRLAGSSVSVAVLLGLASSLAGGQEHSGGDFGRDASWTQFRGTAGDGVGIVEGLPTKWSEDEGVVWKRPIPGKGFSSPVVKDGRVYLTTAVVRPPRHVIFRKTLSTFVKGSLLAFRKEFIPLTYAIFVGAGICLLLALSRLSKALRESRVMTQLSVGRIVMFALVSFGASWAWLDSGATKVTFLVVEIDLDSGEVTRSIEVFTRWNPKTVESKNSYSTPTPAIDDSTIYCHFGRFGTAAVALRSGRIRWSREFEIDHINGPVSSPVLFDGLVLLTNDGADRQFVVALDGASGRTMWRQERPPLDPTSYVYRKSHSTGLVFDYEGQSQFVTASTQWIVGYEPSSGEENWRVKHGMGHTVVPMPVYEDGLVFVTTGFDNADLIAIDPSGRGDVSGSHVVWKASRQIPLTSSPLIVGDSVYVVGGSGVVTCLDCSTGQTRWVERISGNYFASPVYADGKVYFCSEEGVTTIIPAPGDFRVLERNEIAGAIRASPVPVSNGLLLRTEKDLYYLSNVRS